MSWFVYFLRCADNSLYCGITTDLDRRLEAHSAGTGARYTRSRLPVQLVWFSEKPDKSEALQEEYRVKRLRKDEKELLVASQQGRENYPLRVEQKPAGKVST
jgi:putative endonuclease